MKYVSRLFMAIGGFASAALLLTVMSPKAHAVVATLVQVANTRSTPVPNQDVDSPARHPYAQTCGFVSSGCSFPVVPPNTQLVIQTVSAFINGGSPALVQLSIAGGGDLVSSYIPLVAVGGGTFAATQQITEYVDPGTARQKAVTVPPASSTFACTITGYTTSICRRRTADESLAFRDVLVEIEIALRRRLVRIFLGDLQHLVELFAEHVLVALVLLHRFVEHLFAAARFGLGFFTAASMSVMVGGLTCSLYGGSRRTFRGRCATRPDNRGM